MKTTNKILLLLAVSGMFVFSACNKPQPPSGTSNLTKDYNSDVITEWMNVFMTIDKDAIGYRPCPGPTGLAYMGLAVYEICVPGMPEYNSIKGNWSGELHIPNPPSNQEIHYPTAVNAAYGYFMKNFFQNARFATGKNSHITNADAQLLIQNKQLYFENLFENEIHSSVFTNSKAWGEDVARAVWDWYKTDNYAFDAHLNPRNTDPSKPLKFDWTLGSKDASGNVIPGKWYPTNEGGDGGRFPLYGEARTFATSSSEKLCIAPYPYSDKPGSAFYGQALQVYHTCTSNMPFEDKWISEFWSDDNEGLTFSPPTRLIAILVQILEHDHVNLEKAAESVAKMGLALNDNAVACWYSKWHYNVERPETFIKRNIDPNWEPYLIDPESGTTGITPPFPAYPSGHSTFSGGGFAMLTHLFGGAYAFTDNCHKDRVEFIGKPRFFEDFEEAGREDAFSRVTLGVHYSMDCEAGMKLGKAITGRVIKNIHWKK